MKNADVETTIKYTSDLTLLYVEDDLILQSQTKEFLEVLFKSVNVASDGVEALELYTKQHFDLVITDIKMPNMDGIELTKQIKNIKAEQAIIVISAYNNAEYLIDFLNLHINSFLQKPMQINSMLQTLHDVSKNIVNENMIKTYRKQLESNNIKLISLENEFKNIKNILDIKLKQLSKNKFEKDTVNFDSINISKEHFNELNELEVDIYGAVDLIKLSDNLNISNIKILGNLLSSYSAILDNYPDFEPLNSKIETLSNNLNNNPESFIENIERIIFSLGSLIYVLSDWRKLLLNKDTKKAFELHSSIICDINDINEIIQIK